jgi:hypothetical protein
METIFMKNEDLLKNTLLQERFMYAMVRRSISELAHLLADKGRFCGMNKIGFLADLQGTFESQRGLSVVCQVNTAIATDLLPGAEFFEFRFVGMTDFDGFDFPEDVAIGSVPRYNELVLGYSLRFENGKVVEIVEPKQYVKNNNFMLKGLNHSAN